MTLSQTDKLKLSMISNRGIKVFPGGMKETFCTDHWRCRFKTSEETGIDYKEVLKLITNTHNLNLDVIKTENLYKFDGKLAFSLGQGQ